MTQEQILAAKRLLQSLIYDEMTQEQLALVAAYETEVFQSKVDALLASGLSVAQIEEEIHEWWLDFQMADGTEIALCAYAAQKEAKEPVDKLIAGAVECAGSGTVTNRQELESRDEYGI